MKKVFKSFMGGPIYVNLFGLIFFSVGGGLTIKQYAFKQQAIAVSGKVTGHTMGSCDEDGCSYRSVAKFQTQEGKLITYTSTYSSSPPAYDVGEQVTVFYSPENPQKAVIEGEGQLFRIIFMGVGGVIIIFGLVFFASNLKTRILTEEE